MLDTSLNVNKCVNVSTTWIQVCRDESIRVLLSCSSSTGHRHPSAPQGTCRHDALSGLGRGCDAGGATTTSPSNPDRLWLCTICVSLAIFHAPFISFPGDLSVSKVTVIPWLLLNLADGNLPLQYHQPGADGVIHFNVINSRQCCVFLAHTQAAYTAVLTRPLLSKGRERSPQQDTVEPSTWEHFKRKRAGIMPQQEQQRAMHPCRQKCSLFHSHLQC